ncbi:MAG TPA: ABC transporter ATP-binding protein, partial [Rhodospirillaceae bacterium]|nr:ABC transporter ATP-binding protein [Rhodospirillaceae bacterium]
MVPLVALSGWQSASLGHHPYRRNVFTFYLRRRCCRLSKGARHLGGYIVTQGIAIRAEHLSKRYRLREGGGVTGLVGNLNRRLRQRGGDQPAAPQSHFWALDDVSFDIHKGEVVGIIGHNGAGKSTLLKILTRITNPTRGSARVTGRVGMLLEVGTGFHGDLTGRENVFLNGAILGMTRKEIRRKYDDIVAFAEIADFMDLPVRHYSSGMCLRLALSVAVHLDAEVIFLDEIWAVGDQSFQTKTWRRIEELIGSGRTFVIVAHNLETIERLCNRCLLIDHGRLTMDGTPTAVIARYREEIRQRARQDLEGTSGQALRLAVIDAHLTANEVRPGDFLDCRLELEVDRTGEIDLALSVRDANLRPVATGLDAVGLQRWSTQPVVSGRNHFRCAFPAAFSCGGGYELVLEVRSG